MREIDLITSAGHLTETALSDEEMLAVQVKLWQLLARRTRKYTKGDSTSVPVETAEELLKSLCFTLGEYLKEKGQTPKLLLDAELEELNKLFNCGVKVIEGKIETGKELWRSACLGAPSVENLSFRHTLQSIGGFFRYYDYRFLAHQIPCDIDYQLCRPVPDHNLGIEFINEYLRRVIIENNILRPFETGLVIRLLERYCPDYKGLLINLCEPVIVNAIGLTLIGTDPLTLDITESDRIALAGLFRQLPEKRARLALEEAAGQLCLALGIKEPVHQDYLAWTSADLYPRLSAALPHGDLKGIFLSLV